MAGKVVFRTQSVFGVNVGWLVGRLSWWCPEPVKAQVDMNVYSKCCTLAWSCWCHAAWYVNWAQPFEPESARRMVQQIIALSSSNQLQWFEKCATEKQNKKEKRGKKKIYWVERMRKDLNLRVRNEIYGVSIKINHRYNNNIMHGSNANKNTGNSIVDLLTRSLKSPPYCDQTNRLTQNIETAAMPSKRQQERKDQIQNTKKKTIKMCSMFTYRVVKRISADLLFSIRYGQSIEKCKFCKASHIIIKILQIDLIFFVLFSYFFHLWYQYQISCAGVSCFAQLAWVSLRNYCVFIYIHYYFIGSADCAHVKVFRFLLIGPWLGLGWCCVVIVLLPVLSFAWYLYFYWWCWALCALSRSCPRNPNTPLADGAGLHTYDLHTVLLAHFAPFNINNGNLFFLVFFLLFCSMKKETEIVFRCLPINKV